MVFLDAVVVVSVLSEVREAAVAAEKLEAAAVEKAMVDATTLSLCHGFEWQLRSGGDMLPDCSDEWRRWCWDESVLLGG